MPRSPSKRSARQTKPPTVAPRHILMVGGTRGAGAETARLFSERGERVSVLARKAAKSPVEGVFYTAADLIDPGALRAALKRCHQACGPFAGVIFFQRYRGEGDSWDNELATSLSATKQAIELLTDEFQFRHGSIVIVSSINAGLISKDVSVGYHIAKAGMNQLARYYAVSLGPLGIRVNSVSPGSFIKEENRAAIAGNFALLDLHRRIVPLGRLGTAREVAKTIFFLSGEESSFITGQDIIVDGGTSLVYQESLGRQLLSGPLGAPA